MFQGRYMRIALLLILAITTTTTFAKEMVVYGDDNRLDVYESYNSLHKKLADSTAGMVNKKKISTSFTSGYTKITARHKLGSAFGLCSSEKFVNQRLLANCSGFLVSEDTIVTAGHCMAFSPDRPMDDACKDNSWVFGLHMKSASHINLTNISPNKVYNCKKVVKVQYDGYQDFAVIKLDRPVVGIKPLKFRTSGKISSSTPLVVIGHPSMLPTKISDGGQVTDNSGNYKFMTNLDTFQGNSGSAVFNSRTGQLEGILVSGKTDYMHSRPLDKKSCRIVNVCNNSGSNCAFKPAPGRREASGEAVTRITTLTKYFN